MTNLTLREINAADLECLARFLHRNADPETLRLFHPFPMTYETAYQICNVVKKDRYYAAHLGEEIVGLSMLRGFDEGYEIPSFGIVVDRNCRNKGVGRKLTLFTVQQCNQMGCPSVRLSVYASNTHARGLYTMIGFRERERTSILIGNETDERIVMFLEFNHKE